MNPLNVPQNDAQAAPVAPQDLANAFLLIARLLSGEDDFDPTRYRWKVLTEAGRIHEQPFEDTPFNRILLALQEWYREEPREKYLALCRRIFALNELIHDGALAEWVHADRAGYLAIPGAVIQAAAELPLSEGLGFERTVFVERVRRICFLE